MVCAWCRRTKPENLTRNRRHDAFVCYCYDGQDPDFVEKTIPQELEEEYNLKLCIHRRDFKVGWDIKWNIVNAIRNSNSAIIIMSQDYINSLWCVEEFEDCYMENMKDPTFKLFVILMQLVDKLKITNEYMKSFFSKKTYLEREYPKLFNKIADYLTWMRQLNGKKPPLDGATDDTLNPLLKQHEVVEGDRIVIDKDKENIELRKVNNQIGVDVDCKGTDEEYNDCGDDDEDDDGGHDTCDQLPPEINTGEVSLKMSQTLKTWK